MFGKFYTINFNSYPAMVTIIPTVTITNIQNLALPAVVLLMNNPRTAREAYDNIEYSKISEKISKTPWNREHWITVEGININYNYLIKVIEKTISRYNSFKTQNFKKIVLQGIPAHGTIEYFYSCIV